MADKEFLCSFPHGGSRWSFTIWAADWPDAEAKLASLKAWAKIEGTDLVRVYAPPMPPGAARIYGNFVTSLVRWWRGAPRD